MATACPRAAKDPDKKGTTPAALRSAHRLTASARRDIRSAMQQVPGDSVRDVTVHGVKISFNASTNVQAKGAAPLRRSEISQDSQRPEHAEKPLNAAQRRSRARAKKHYAALKQAKDAMAPEDPASTRPTDSEPLV